ncbi:hypothetical protein N0V85_009892, partial [Neurospora sp. IMI 360204]
ASLVDGASSLLIRLVANVVAEYKEVVKDIETLAPVVNEQFLRLAQLKKKKEELTVKGREMSLAALAELEEWDEADRAAGREPEPLPEAYPAEVSTSDASASVDWASLDVSAFPVSWLGSPSPLAGPGSSDGIPPASQGNSNS